MADYQSIFTGNEIDSRLEAVTQLQLALIQLEDAVASKYSRPSGGIPARDMDAEVNAALKKAMTAVQSLADYYTKSQVDAIATAIAATVNATSGVTVASLPDASADTLGKIYYVGPSEGEYDRYVTSYDGSSYSWLPLGSSAIDLSEYTPLEDFNALSAKVGDGDIETVTSIPTVPDLIAVTTGKYFNWSTLSAQTYSNYQYARVVVKAGERYLISAFYLSSSGRAVTLVNSSTSAKISMLDGAASTHVRGEIVIPEGYDRMFINGRTADYPVLVVKISPDVVSLVDVAKAGARKYTVPFTIYPVGGIIDARVDSATFGQVIAATNMDWGVSPYINVKGAEFIRYYANIASTSNNYYYIAGAVFYDGDLQPITEGVRLIEKGNPAYSGYVLAEVPAGAHYIRWAAGVNHSGDATIFQMSEADFASSLNDFTGGKAYFGETIDLDRQYKRTTFAANGSASQSAAVWGRYLFFVFEKLDSIRCYDMETHSHVYTYTHDFGGDSSWHCNQSNFGTVYFDESDMFPILWTSARGDSQGRCRWIGLRIDPTLNAQGVVTSFTASIVQTIYLPAMTDANALGNANIAVDAENGYLWAYSRNNNSEAANYQKMRFSKFAIPALFDNGVAVPEVFLTDADILDSFEEDFSALNAQGGIIRNGKLFVAQGFKTAGYINMRVVDLYFMRKQVSFINLLADGYEEEPEGVFYYDGKLFYTSGNASIYSLAFKN